MKRIIIITILLSTFTALSAQDVYVRVGVVGQKNLFNAFYRIKELNYKAHSVKRNELITVYGGPFSNRSQATQALFVIKKEISKNAYLVTLSGAKESRVAQVAGKPKKKKRHYSYEKSEKSEKVINKDFFVGLNFGVGLANVDENDDNFDSEYGMSFGLEAGYYLTNNIFTSITYQRVDLDDVTFDNIYTKLDYKFSDIYPVSPYVGAIFGYSVLGWNDYVESSDTASSYCYGVELGSEVYVTQNVLVGFSYSYTLVDFETTYNTLEIIRVISHKGLHNLSFGIKYSFN